MHDPDTVAHTIRRPWPSPTRFGGHGDQRWRIRRHHECGTWCADDPPHKSGAFPWWRPRSYSPFWRLAGRDFFWQPMIIIWHREPGGKDGLTVCSRRYQDKNGRWHFTKGWRWHVHHWRIDVPLVHHLLNRREGCLP